MKIFDGYMYREATEEEAEEHYSVVEETISDTITDAERIDALEEAIRKGMSL